MQFTPWDNPMGTDGFEFIEYTAPDPKALGALFEQMGFRAIAKHRQKNVTLYRQGEINFLVNAEKDSFAQRFARQHLVAHDDIHRVAGRPGHGPGRPRRQAARVRGAGLHDRRRRPQPLKQPAGGLRRLRSTSNLVSAKLRECSIRRHRWTQ